MATPFRVILPKAAGHMRWKAPKLPSPGEREDLGARLRREGAANVREFFQALDFKALRRASRGLKEPGVSEVRDEVYRVFHHSFKMYFLAGSTFTLASLMMEPLGWKPTTGEARASLIAAMRRWHLDPWFIYLVEQSFRPEWSQKRNAERLWLADAQQLASSYMIVREVVTASLEAMERMRRGTGFLFETDEPLDPTDALFLEVWNGLGVPLRYMAGGPKWEALQEECRERLREKAKG